MNLQEEVTFTPDVNEQSEMSLRQLSQHMAHTARMALLKASAHQMDPAKYPLDASSDSFERLFLSYLRTRSPETQARTATRVKALLSGPRAQQSRLFTGPGRVDLHSSTPVQVQLHKMQTPARVQQERDVLQKRLVTSSQSKATDSKPTPVFKFDLPTKLEFRLYKVLCEDETFELDSSADRISLGGIGTDADGDITKIDPFTLSNDFDKNEQVFIDPNKHLVVFDLREKVKWPRTYQVTLLLCEKDDGKRTALLSDIAKEGKKEMQRRYPGLDPNQEGWSGLFAQVLDYLCESVFGWLSSLGEDDLFPPLQLQTTLKVPSNVFENGRRDCDLRYGRVVGLGGAYGIYYYWRLCR